MSKKYVLSLCDYSGTWSEPYREAGFTVIQVDLKLGSDTILFPSLISSESRYSRDFLDIAPYIGDTWAVLAAPVCTVFSGSGAKHKRSDKDIIQGLSLVDACYRIATVTKADVFALENPVGKLRKWIGEPLLRFQPYDYAGYADNPRSEQYSKRTCLWGWFDPRLPTAPLENIDGSKLWAQYGGKSDRTKELRSMTPQGFARAFYAANH